MAKFSTFNKSLPQIHFRFGLSLEIFLEPETVVYWPFGKKHNVFFE